MRAILVDSFLTSPIGECLFLILTGWLAGILASLFIIMFWGLFTIPLGKNEKYKIDNKTGYIVYIVGILLSRPHGLFLIVLYFYLIFQFITSEIVFNFFWLSFFGTQAFYAVKILRDTRKGSKTN